MKMLFYRHVQIATVTISNGSVTYIHLFYHLMCCYTLESANDANNNNGWIFYIIPVARELPMWVRHIVKLLNFCDFGCCLYSMSLFCIILYTACCPFSQAYIKSQRTPTTAAKFNCNLPTSSQIFIINYLFIIWATRQVLLLNVKSVQLIIWKLPVQENSISK